MLKESTMQRYTVEQLMNHFVKNTENYFIYEVFTTKWIMKKTLNKVTGHYHYQYIVDDSKHSKERIKELIREHT